MTVHTLNSILSAVEHAETKHPVFPDSYTGMASKLAEEALEAIQALNDLDEGKGCEESAKIELAQVTAVCVRCLEALAVNPVIDEVEARR